MSRYKLRQARINLLPSFLILLSCLVPLSSEARVKDSTALSGMIKKVVFTCDGGAFQGAGWDTLQKEISKVQFLMIGEQHGEAEIPFFTEKIAAVFKPKAFVAEIDPYSAGRLKKIAGNPAGYAEHFRKWPYDLAFYCWETEMQLARHLLSENIDIWGLNEITFMSTGLFFEELASASKLPAHKAFARKKAVEYGNQDRQIYTAPMEQWSGLSYAQLRDSYIDTLIVSFQKDNARSRKMLLDLKASRITYGGNYPERINIMKKNLLNYVAPYISKDSINIPKLLFKFGANHVTRTDDLTGFFEVGSLADHLAAAAGKKNLHIFIFGKKGTINTMVSPDNNKAIQPYSVAHDEELTMMKPFYDQLDGREWAVFDLRPLRRALDEGRLTGSTAGINNFIRGFDLLVVFAQTTGNKFIH
jgi:hypothetical protein